MTHDEIWRAAVAWREADPSERRPVDEAGGWTQRDYKLLSHLSYATYLRTRHWLLTRQRQLAHASACERCGTPHPDEIHHLLYDTVGAEQAGRDLQTLCWLCHREVHPEKNADMLLALEASRRDFDEYWDWFDSLPKAEQDALISRSTARPR